MTNTDQTFVKQRIEQEIQVEGGYGNQAEAFWSSQFLDIRDHHLQAAAGSESQARLTVTGDGAQSPEGTVIEEQLRTRIRELEAHVRFQNQEIHNAEVIKRNYKAAVSRLLRTEQEKDLLEEDRERCYRESRFYQLQAQEKTVECEKHEDRLRDMRANLVEKDQKVRELERQLCFFKENSGHEADDRTSSNNILQKTLKDTSIHSGTNCGQDGLFPKKRRREFRQSLTSLPKCSNCQTVFDSLQPHEVDCSFHRTNPQPLKVWRPQLDIKGKTFTSLELRSYRFWPCCEKYGVKEPPGCLTLKCHDLVYPEDD